MEQKLNVIVYEIQSDHLKFRIERAGDMYSVLLQNAFTRDGFSASNLIKSGDMIEVIYDNSVFKAILDCEVSIENVIDFDENKVKFKLKNSYAEFEWPIRNIRNPKKLPITLRTRLKIDIVKDEVRQVSYYEENSPARLAQTETQHQNIHSTVSNIHSFHRPAHIQAQYGDMVNMEEAKSQSQVQIKTSIGYSHQDISSTSLHQGAAHIQNPFENQGYHHQDMSSKFLIQSPMTVQTQYNPERQTIHESVQGAYPMYLHLNSEPPNIPQTVSQSIPSDLQKQQNLIIPKGINPYLSGQAPERNPSALQGYQPNPTNQDRSSNHPSLKMDYPAPQVPSAMPNHYNYMQDQPHIYPNTSHIAPYPTHQSYSLSPQLQANPYNLPDKPFLSDPTISQPSSQLQNPSYDRSISRPTFPKMLPEPYKPKGRFEELLNRKLQTCGIERLPIISLKEDFKGSRSIQARIDQISTKFDSWRRVRGDGNCYYRAVAVAYLEHLFRYTTDYQEIQDFLNKSRPSEYFSEEDRQYFLLNLHDLYVRKHKGDNVIRDLNEKLQDIKFDSGMIGVFRLLAADYLNMNRENPDIRDFVFDMQGDLNRIITMGIEAEGMEFHCMSGALGVFIKHISLVDENDNVFLCSSERAPILFILYKKGHYDLLYTRLHNEADGYSLAYYQFQEPSYEKDNQEFVGKFYVSKEEAEISLVKVKPAEERKACVVVNPRGLANLHIPNIPNRAPQAKDKCLFCNEIKNEDEFYKDKICKCKMCLNCYFEQQSFTTCKKCFEPLSMERMSSCKKCRTKKFERYIITLECKHNFCQECLKNHILNEVRYFNGRVSCPDGLCREPISIEIRDQIIPQGYAKDEKSIKSNETLSSSSHGTSICNICRYSDTVVFITRLDCNHSFCTDCLKKYLDYKINTDLLKRKGIECCICDFIISDETIKKVVDLVTYYEYLSKMETRMDITVKCPKKHRTIVNGKNADCQKCGINFCVVCKKAPHNGICQKTGFKTQFLGVSHEDVCPDCNKRNRKSRNSEGNYIICKNPDCNKSLCKYCYQRYSPILAHGPLYHRFDCKFREYSLYYETEYNPLECEECKKLGALCRRPS